MKGKLVNIKKRIQVLISNYQRHEKELIEANHRLKEENRILKLLLSKQLT